MLWLLFDSASYTKKKYQFLKKNPRNVCSDSKTSNLDVYKIYIFTSGSYVELSYDLPIKHKVMES